MDTIATVFASSRIIYMILVPVLRELAGVLLAVAISKDCKARDNGSGALWGLFTLIAPAFFGIIYCIYSRFLVHRDAKTPQDKKQIKKSRKLTIWAILVYVFAIILAVICIITTTASGIAAFIKDDGSNINSLLYEEYYDMNGVKYDDGEKVVLYDKDGNAYHIAESLDGWNYFTYFDEKGTEYDLDKCYISKDGYFYYDKNDTLIPDREGILVYEYDKVFHDENAAEYKRIGNYAFFDKDGKIVINHLNAHGSINEYAFE